MRIAINGMGRIGRLLFKRLLNNDNYEIVAVNDLMPADNLAYLLKYDSVYGTMEQAIYCKDDSLFVDHLQIPVFQKADPASLPWKQLEVDIVLECTGSFTSQSSMKKHLEAGAKKVLLSTTGADDLPLKIYGFNQTSSIASLNMIAAGGCMTNCSTHVLFILNSIGIDAVHINVLHSYTSRQALVDAPHRDFRRGRAAAESIIPVDVDLYKSLNRLLPSLKGKIYTSSTRVPVANGAMANFYVSLKESPTVEHINELFRKAAEQDFKGIVGFCEDPIVSLDIKGNTNSCIIDGTQTSIVGNQLRLVAWFDNEYGFTSRMIDWLNYWHS